MNVEKNQSPARMMNQKPVFFVPNKTVINFNSNFGHKQLCDGITFTREGVLLDSVMGNSQTQKPEQVAARCLLQAITKLKCRPKEILMSRTSLAFALEPITRPLEIRTSHVAKLKELDGIYRRLMRSVDLDRC
jgi:hypothetical protein